MNALVLSGGGFKGSYQIGVWKALKKLNYKIDIVTGTSIGSLNGAFVTSKQYYKVIKLWNHLKPDFLFNEEINEEYLMLEYARNIIKNKGMNVKNLENNINKYLNKKRFFNSKIKYGLVTVNKKTMQPKYMSKEKLNGDNIADYLIASSTLYPLFQTKKIGEEEYVDGGFHDYIPVDYAIEMGATNVIAVDLEAIGIKKKVKNEANIVYIKPNNDIGSIIKIDKKQISDNIKYGYYDTMKKFGQLDGNKYTFKKGEIKKCFEKYKEKYKLFAQKKKKGTTITEKEFLRIIESAATICEIDQTKIYRIKTMNRLITKIIAEKNMFKNEIKQISKSTLVLTIGDKIVLYLKAIN